MSIQGQIMINIPSEIPLNQWSRDRAKNCHISTRDRSHDCKTSEYEWYIFEIPSRCGPQSFAHGSSYSSYIVIQAKAWFSGLNLGSNRFNGRMGFYLWQRNMSESMNKSQKRFSPQNISSSARSMRLKLSVWRCSSCLGSCSIPGQFDLRKLGIFSATGTLRRCPLKYQLIPSWRYCMLLGFPWRYKKYHSWYDPNQRMIFWVEI